MKTDSEDNKNLLSVIAMRGTIPCLAKYLLNFV